MLKILFTSSSSACFEWKNELPYYTEKEYISKDVAKDDPLAYILGFEDAMNEFVKLAQREHQLDIEEGKIAGGSTFEQILDDGIVMMGESTSATSTTRTAPVIEDIEL